MNDGRGAAAADRPRINTDGAESCAENHGQCPQPDSAGVEIVEMSGAFAADAPELTLREDLRIGALDGSVAPQKEE